MSPCIADPNLPDVRQLLRCLLPAALPAKQLRYIECRAEGSGLRSYMFGSVRDLRSRIAVFGLTALRFCLFLQIGDPSVDGTPNLFAKSVLGHGVPANHRHGMACFPSTAQDMA